MSARTGKDAPKSRDQLQVSGGDGPKVREDKSRKQRSGLPIEAAASHLVTAGVGWLALRFFRLFKRQQRSLQEASGEPEAEEPAWIACMLDTIPPMRMQCDTSRSSDALGQPDLLYPLLADQLKLAQVQLQAKESKVEELEESLKDVQGKVTRNWHAADFPLPSLATPLNRGPLVIKAFSL